MTSGHVFISTVFHEMTCASLYCWPKEPIHCRGHRKIGVRLLEGLNLHSSFWQEHF